MCVCYYKCTYGKCVCPYVCTLYIHVHVHVYTNFRVSYRGGALEYPPPSHSPPPPPEILKFSMVFGHLVCVIKINFVQDCVRSNLRRSKNQNFPGGQVQLLLPTFMSQQGATKRSCTASKGLSRLPLLYFKLCSNTFTTTLSMYISLLCRPVTPSTYTYTLSMWTQQFVCNIT